MSADDDQWSEEYTPLQWEENMAAAHEEEKRLANEEVKKAMEAFYAQKWYQKLPQRMRSFAYWCTYWLRLKFAMAFVSLYCRLTGKESRLVSPKVWHRLGI